MELILNGSTASSPPPGLEEARDVRCMGREEGQRDMAGLCSTMELSAREQDELPKLATALSQEQRGYEYTQLGNSKKISCHQKWNSLVIKIDLYKAKFCVYESMKELI